MKAIIQQHGDPGQVVVPDLPVPQPVDGDILIRGKAFGINQAEIRDAHRLMESNQASGKIVVRVCPDPRRKKV